MEPDLFRFAGLAPCTGSRRHRGYWQLQAVTGVRCKSGSLLVCQQSWERERCSPTPSVCSLPCTEGAPLMLLHGEMCSFYSSLGIQRQVNRDKKTKALSAFSNHINWFELNPQILNQAICLQIEFTKVGHVCPEILLPKWPVWCLMARLGIDRSLREGAWAHVWGSRCLSKAVIF